MTSAADAVVAALTSQRRSTSRSLQPRIFARTSQMSSVPAARRSRILSRRLPPARHGVIREQDVDTSSLVQLPENPAEETAVRLLAERGEGVSSPRRRIR